MKKYRIVRKGTVRFVIQKRRFFVFWKYMSSHYTLDTALAFIEDFRYEDESSVVWTG